MRICFNNSIRLVSGATLATLLNLSLGACSPVTLEPDTDTDGSGDGTAGDETGGASSGASGAEGGSGSEDNVPAACIDLEPRVLGVLENTCAKCHGGGSPAQGGIDYILDLDALISENKVNPGSPEDSRIYVRMAATDSPMPPLSEMQRPTENDIKSVEAWIRQCAGVQSCADQEFISTSTMLDLISNDLNSADVNILAVPFTRYFSFVHLHNAGYCDAEIDIFRHALSKLVNSLSLETKIVAPVPIDPDRLIYRIDIRDYDWDRDLGEGKFALSEPSFYFNDPAELLKTFEDRWEMIADQNPYNIEYEGEQAEKIKADAKTDFPIMQGDAFIDVSTRSPLYYDILSIPDNRIALELSFGIDIVQNLSDERAQDNDKVARAAFHVSDVSDFHRVIERHEFPGASNRSYWLSFDFSSQAGDKNVFTKPFDFNFDGGEAIFNLQNGMQAYLLVDAAGVRINEAPTNIVRDKNQKDGIVRNGISCIGCHSSGMIKAQDDLRWEVDAGQAGTIFPAEVLDEIRRVYPLREEFTTLLDIDTQRFLTAMTTAKVPTETPKEPLITTFLAFDENVTLRRAAAELGLTEQELSKDLGKLSEDLNDLSKTDGNVLRPDFSANFAESACTLNRGRTRACPSSDPQNPTTGN